MTLRALSISAIAISLLTAPAAAADRLILRDLTVITGKSAIACDEDGVQLNEPLEDGRKVLGWDELEQGRVSPELQERFDLFKSELGLNLFRLKQRLKTGDYRRLLEPAEKLWPRFAGRKSDSAYLVAQSLMWGHLANGEREAALAPYLRCVELLRSGAAEAKRLPGDRHLRFDPTTGLSPDLKPLWFNPDAAKAALPEVREAITGMSQPRPEATRLYFGTLAIAAGDLETASKMLDAWMPDARPLIELRSIALLQREMQAGQGGGTIAGDLQAGLSKLLPENRPLAEYWLAVSRAAAKASLSRQDAAIDFLSIAAKYGTGQRDISAAAILAAKQALEEAGDAAGAAILARELRENYANTAQSQAAKGRPIAAAPASGVK